MAFGLDGALIDCPKRKKERTALMEQLYDAYIYLDTGEVFVDKGPMVNIESLSCWLANNSWYTIGADATRSSPTVLINVSHTAYIKLKPSEVPE